MTIQIRHFRITEQVILHSFGNPHKYQTNLCKCEIKMISVICLYLIEVAHHLSVEPKIIYNITPLNKEWFLELHHIYASATKSKNEKVCIIGDSHLKRINKVKFRKELGRFIYLL